MLRIMHHFIFFIVLILVPNSQDLLAKEKDGELWIFDMTQCNPAEATSYDNEQGKWMAVDYEIDRGKGVMLFGMPGSDAPLLTLKPNLRGWYEIRLGIFYGTFGGVVTNRIICAALSSDYEQGAERFSLESVRAAKDGDYPEKNITGSDLAEVFWKCADLTGQDLMLSCQGKGTYADFGSNIAYIRFVPMNEKAIEEWQSEQPTEQTKKLIANYDGSTIFQWGLTTRRDFLSEFKCLRDSDFDIALYSIARSGNTFYPSNVGSLIRKTGWQGWGEAVNTCVDSGLDPLDEAIEAAHACGIKLFPRNRLYGKQLPPSHLSIDMGGKLMADHPEWMQVDRDGSLLRHLSFAFPGVRDFHVRLLREWVEDYKADGINMLFSRSSPFVYCEQPVRHAFREKYGEDIRTVPDSDIRLQQLRAGFITEFLRSVRVMLDEVGQEQNRYIPACYSVPINCTVGYRTPTESPDLPGIVRDTNVDTPTGLGESMYNALDVSTWIHDGLIDYLVLHLHVYGEHDGSAMQPVIREFTNMAKGTKTKVYADIYPRRMPPRKYREIAMNYYDADVDGLSFWDSYVRCTRASEWAFIKRIGHRDDLVRWKGKGDDYYRVIPLKSIDGIECKTKNFHSDG